MKTEATPSKPAQATSQTDDTAENGAAARAALRSVSPNSADEIAREVAENRAATAQLQELKPRILVIGVGGAGGNAINNMIDKSLGGVEFICANTDAQALSYSKASHRLQLGRSVTTGLGAGGDPRRGAEAAQDSAETIADAVTGAHMVFVAAGMGGGTGTGAAPVVAEIARQCGALTVAVVTKPFFFEGPLKMRRATDGLARLSEHVDAQIVIPNQNIYRIIEEDTSFVDAFRMADEVLHQGVRSITDLMVRPGHINLDFADVRAIMEDMGPAIMGAGEADGENRALMAAERAINNPLFDDVSVRGARSILVNVASDDSMSLREIDAAVSRVRAEAEDDALLACGVSIDPSLDGRIRVSVVATGVEHLAERAAPESDVVREAPVEQPRASAPSAAPAAVPEVVVEPAPAPEPTETVAAQAPKAGPVAMPPVAEPQPAPSVNRSPLHHVSAESAPTAPPPLGHARGGRAGAEIGAALGDSLAEPAPRGIARRVPPADNARDAAPRAPERPLASKEAAVSEKPRALTEAARTDPMSVDIPDFLRRQAAR